MGGAMVVAILGLWSADVSWNSNDRRVAIFLRARINDRLHGRASTHVEECAEAADHLCSG